MTRSIEVTALDEDDEWAAAVGMVQDGGARFLLLLSKSDAEKLIGMAGGPGERPLKCDPLGDRRFRLSMREQ